MKGEMEGYLVKPEKHKIPSPWTVFQVSPWIEFQVIWQISRDAEIYAIGECDPKPIFLNTVSFFSWQKLIYYKLEEEKKSIPLPLCDTEDLFLKIFSTILMSTCSWSLYKVFKVLAPRKLMAMKFYL